ncbi:hypothetical protein LJC31_07340, partial [Synergistaceae bacterium OttesenSCG-928-I11]|nr:hypothetical protein [Synergistaceae bacterium OttesenSCG-928-I11]
MGEAERFDGLQSLPRKMWERNRALHLPVGGAARPWICRGFTYPLLVVLPNSRAARDFVADAEAMRGAVDLSHAAV